LVRLREGRGVLFYEEKGEPIGNGREGEVVIDLVY